MILEKGLDRFFKIINGFCRILLLIIFAVMWIVVFGRYLFNKTPVWGEEVVLLAMAWLAMLSGADALRNDQHIKITLIDKYVPEKFIKVQTLIYDIIITIVSCIMFKYAFEVTMNNISVHYMGLKISEAFVYAAMPVGYSLIVLIKLEKYYKWFLNRKTTRERG